MAAPPVTTTGVSVPHERRLATVVFTDVVGYSTMVQADESGTVTRVCYDLDRMRAQSAAHGGECLNSMGDGLMLAFASAVEAVAFALEAQEAFATRNEATPAEAVTHRIGIHLGDVLRMPDGLLAGDGVNIAARLEGSAPPGGICISQTVHEIVRGQLALQAHFAGPQSFKNIEAPIPVWHLHPRGLAHAVPDRAPAEDPRVRRRLVLAATGTAAVLAGSGLWFLRRRAAPQASGYDPKSIAVLPFLNLSDDKDTSYFADGVHEDLLTHLALLGELRVVSRTSVMEYRNTAKKIPEIGRELKVSSLVEGSVRRVGDSVRVTAQLVDAQSDQHVWAANYDRTLSDIFKVQSELATEIARQLNVSLSTAEERRLARAPTTNLQAFDLLLRHRALARESEGRLRSYASVTRRVELLKRAVALDPNFALAWARLAAEHARARGYGLDLLGDQKSLAERALSRALALAPDDLQVKIEEAAVCLHAQDDHAGARRAYEVVLAEAPYDVDALDGLAEVLAELGEAERTVAVLERALAVDARHPGALGRLSDVYGRYRHFDHLLDLRRQMVAIRPGDVDVRIAYERWTYAKTGSWAAYDAWRSTLPGDLARRSYRIRLADADRAAARSDFAEVHRLIDMDSEDFPNSSIDQKSVGALLRGQHALAWNAAGDTAQARRVASEALSIADKALAKGDKDTRLQDTRAAMLALLGRQPQAFESLDRAVSIAQEAGDRPWTRTLRRRRADLQALLGDHAQAIETLREQARQPDFLIHARRVALHLAPIWKHPDFLALVADPQTNARLPLDTPAA